MSERTTFRFEHPQAPFDTVDNNRLHVTNETNARVGGTTNLAPGTVLEVRALRTGTNPFIRTSTAVVQADGTWSTQMDFSVAEIGQRFTASIRAHGETIHGLQGEVVAQAPDPAASFERSNLQAPETAPAGDQITTSATVTNVGDGDGDVTVEYRFDGEVVDTTTVTLDAGAEQSVQFDHTPDSSGTFTHGISIPEQELTAEIEIEEPTADETVDDEEPADDPSETDADEEPADDSPTDDDDIPGFGVVGAVLALLLAAVAAARYTRQSR